MLKPPSSGQGRHVARGAAEPAGHRVAPPRKVDPAIEPAEAAAHGLDLRHHAIELHVAQVERGANVRRVLGGVDADGAGQLAAGHAQVERVEGEHAVGQLDLHAAAVERHVAHVADAIGGVFHVGVHCAQAVEVERGGGQHLVARRPLGLLDGGRRRHAFDRLGRALSGRQADEGAQVVHVHQARAQLAREARQLSGLVETHVARNVGKAEPALEPCHFPQLGALAQVAAQRIGRGLRQRDAKQRKQGTERLALEFELRVDAVEIGEVGHRAFGLEAGLPRRGIDLHRKRFLAGRLELQHVAGAPLGRERLALVAALDAVAERQRAAARVVAHVGVQIDAQVRGQEIDRAVVDLHQADDGHGSGIRGVLAERPCAAPVRFHLEPQRRREQCQARNHDLLREQRPQPYVELGALGLHQVGIAGPWRVGKLDAVELHGGAAQAHAHIEPPRDLELAPGFFADVAVDRLAQCVPRKERDHHRQRSQQQHESRKQLEPEWPVAKDVRCHGVWIYLPLDGPGRQ